MKKYLVITIDVEPDCSKNWKYSSPLTFTGISDGIKKKLQPLFNKYDIVPTYLINNVVLEDEESIDIFRSLDGKFELGTHLHPEFIEPHKEYSDYAGKKGIANCCYYDAETEFLKIRNITRLFESKFGFSPTSFRAGRFSAGNNTISSLQKLNYKIDTSVTPNINWNDKTRERPVDFRKAPEQPYWLSIDIDAPSMSKGGILEVPVSIVSKKISLISYFKQALIKKRLPLKRTKAVWLRPVFSGMDDFKMIISISKNNNKDKNVLVYNMMFHNVEVMPGCSPYSLTEEDCKAYMDLLESFFIYITTNNIDSIALSGLYEIFQ